MDNAVALAAISALATTVGIIGWVVKKVLGDIAPALNKHSSSADGLSKAVDKNSQTVSELHDFMVNLNGSLKKAVQDHKE